MDETVREVGAADDAAERFDLIVISMGSGAEDDVSCLPRG
jgi:hypothetical protein